MPSNIPDTIWPMNTASKSLAAFSAWAAVFAAPVSTGVRLDGAQRVGDLEIGGTHPITSISACSAPAALIACRIEIMSRGPTPSAFSPLTSTSRLTPSRTMMS